MASPSSSASGPSAPDPPYKLPDDGPTAARLAAQQDFQERVKASLPTVRSAAEKWRNGLSALITLVTTGLLLTGPKAANGLTTPWRAGLTVVVGGGLGVAVYGLLQCLAVEAGAPTRISLDEIVRVHGSLTRFDIHLANLGVERLKRGRRAGIVAIGLLGVAAPSSWWAEEEPRPPTKPVVAVEAGEETICGTLASADNGHVIVQVDGEEKPRVINFDALDNLRVATTCP